MIFIMEESYKAINSFCGQLGTKAELGRQITAEAIYCKSISFTQGKNSSIKPLRRNSYYNIFCSMG